MARIVWHSNAPWAPTGYGQQTAEFTPRFRDAGHDVAISAFWGLGGTPQSWEGMRIYGSDEQGGNLYLPLIANHWKADLTITLMDVWLLKEPSLAEMNLATWVPVDHDPIPHDVAKVFEWSGARPIAMSRFGERQLADKGFDPLYVPHGIDTNVFRPRPGAREEMRELLDIPKDGFVIGMVAANKSNGQVHRKSFPEVFRAFAEFQRTHDDAYLYLHTEMLGRFSGLNLVELALAHKIPVNRMRWTNAWMYELGVEPNDMSCLYSMMDVFANPAHGEGFGIPIIEAQACGVPVIVTDWTAMPELCGSGWLVDGERCWDAPQHSFFKTPSIADLTDTFEDAYLRRGDEVASAKAREFARSYDAEFVMEAYWKPALEQLLAGEGVEGEPPAVEVIRPTDDAKAAA